MTSACARGCSFWKIWLPSYTEKQEILGKTSLKPSWGSRKYQTNDGCWWWKPNEGTELPVVQNWGNVWTCLKTHKKPFVWPSWQIGIFLQFFFSSGPGGHNRPSALLWLRHFAAVEELFIGSTNLFFYIQTKIKYFWIYIPKACKPE